jgi:hypothetical protein
MSDKYPRLFNGQGNGLELNQKLGRFRVEEFLLADNN